MSELEHNNEVCCKQKIADQTIRKHVAIAVATGMVPVPIFDIIALLGVQVSLVKKLSEIHNKTFKETAVKNIIASLVGSVTPVALTPLAFSLLKAIPVVGYTVSALSLAALGGASTYAVGQIFNKHFAEGGSIEDLSAEKVKDDFAKEYEDGKKVAKDASATSDLTKNKENSVSV